MKKKIVTDVFNAQPGDLIQILERYSHDQITLGIVIYVSEDHIKVFWTESGGSSSSKVASVHRCTDASDRSRSKFMLRRNKGLKKCYLLERYV